MYLPRRIHVAINIQGKIRTKHINTQAAPRCISRQNISEFESASLVPVSRTHAHVVPIVKTSDHRHLQFCASFTLHRKLASHAVANPPSSRNTPRAPPLNAKEKKQSTWCNFNLESSTPMILDHITPPVANQPCQKSKSKRNRSKYQNSAPWRTPRNKLNSEKKGRLVFITNKTPVKTKRCLNDRLGQKTACLEADVTCSILNSFRATYPFPNIM